MLDEVGGDLGRGPCGWTVGLGDRGGRIFMPNLVRLSLFALPVDVGWGRVGDCDPGVLPGVLVPLPFGDTDVLPERLFDV